MNGIKEGFRGGNNNFNFNNIKRMQELARERAAKLEREASNRIAQQKADEERKQSAARAAADKAAADKAAAYSKKKQAEGGWNAFYSPQEMSARERAAKLEREASDKIAQQKADQEKKQSAERAAADKAAADSKKKQAEEDAARLKTSLQNQVATLTTSLNSYRQKEADYNKANTDNDFYSKQNNDINKKYQDSLNAIDDLKNSINVADEVGVALIEDRQNVRAKLTKLFVDNTKKPIDVYNQIVNQNRILNEKIDNLKDKFTVGDQKSFYESQQLDYLLNVKTTLYFFYYALVIILLVILFIVNRNDNVSKVWKLVILLLFIAYPYAVGIIESWLYSVGILAYSIINGDAYIP